MSDTERETETNKNENVDRNTILLQQRIEEIDEETAQLEAALQQMNEKSDQKIDGVKAATPTEESKTFESSPRVLSNPQLARDCAVSTRKSSRYAYVSLVMCGDAYVVGALPLAASLKLSGTKHDCVCLVTKDVSDTARRQLSTIFDRVLQVDYVEARCSPMKTAVQNRVYSSWINKSFTKWRILTLTEYDKVLFMDSDVIVLRNMDELFELSAPAGTFSNCWGWPYMKSTKRRPHAPESKMGIRNPFYGNVPHGRSVSTTIVRQGLQGSFAVCGTTVLLKPSQFQFDELLRILGPYLIRPVPPRSDAAVIDNGWGFTSCHSGHDEQVIAYLYCKQGIRWTHISQQFNFIPWHANWLKEEGQGESKFGRPYVFHYIMKKPWVCTDEDDFDPTCNLDSLDLAPVVSDYGPKRMDRQLCILANGRLLAHTAKRRWIGIAE